METVTPDSLFVELIGDGVLVRDPVMAAMKSSVEAGDLRKRREVRKEGFDRREIVGLMKRCQRNVSLEARDQPMIDRNGPVIVGTTMNHTMSDRHRCDAEFVTKPGTRHHQCGRNIRNRLDRIGAIG